MLINDTVTHPRWCDPGRCYAGDGEREHRSAPVVLRTEDARLDLLWVRCDEVGVDQQLGAAELRIDIRYVPSGPATQLFLTPREARALAAQLFVLCWQVTYQRAPVERTGPGGGVMSGAEATGVPVGERGVRALGVGATPEERARAEAGWRASDDLEGSCRCSGTCWHGGPLEHHGPDGVPCAGRLLHVDRYPGSLVDVIAWCDVYVCATCGHAAERCVRLPEIPWGELSRVSSTGTRVYPGVRHPWFPEGGAS
jgi:hypothetical protein